MKQWQYGPDSKVINTNLAFDVSVSFPTIGGSLRGISITLNQSGRLVQFMTGEGMDLHEVYSALKRGVYPGFSYWHTHGAASWYDGLDCSNDQGKGGTAYYTAWSLSGGPTSPLPSSPPSPSSPSSGYTHHAGVNCFQDMGSTDLERSGKCSIQSLADCKSLCDQTSGCQGVTVADKGSDVKCCRRSNVKLEECVHNDQYYSTWTKDNAILL